MWQTKRKLKSIQIVTVVGRLGWKLTERSVPQLLLLIQEEVEQLLTNNILTFVQAVHSLFISNCYQILFSHSMGWCCVVGVFGLIGC